MCNFFIFEKSATYEKKCVKILFASVFHGFFSLSIFFMKIEFKRFTIKWKFYLILVIFLLGLILLLLKLRWKKFIKKWKNSEKGFYQIKCSVSILLLRIFYLHWFSLVLHFSQFRFRQIFLCLGSKQSC